MEAELSEALCYLVSGKGNNFFARILSALQVREDASVPYMGVAFEGRHISLFFNPAWLRQAPFDEVVATIEHEALHLVLEHIPRMLAMLASFSTPEQKDRFHRCSPLAADMADNCLLVESNTWVKENPDGWVWPDKDGFDFPPDQTYEFYVKELMKRDENAPLPLDGMGSTYKLLGNHAAWKAASDTLSDEEKLGLSDELRDRVKNIVRKAVEDHKKARGSIPAGIDELVNRILEPPKIPWTQLLRDRIVNARRSKPRRSIARPNRRHVGVPGLCPFPGRVRDPAFNVAFCIDTSGSMGTRELEIALSELQHLQKADDDILIHVIECDASVGRVYTIGPHDAIEYKLTGRGGTTFDPALIQARQLKPDICFYYTDGYAPAPQAHNRVPCPMVWLISPRGVQCDADWGFTLRMVDQ